MGHKTEKIELKYTDAKSQQLFDNIEAYKSMLKSKTERSEYQVEFLKSRYSKSLDNFRARQKSLDNNRELLKKSSGKK